jgi:hypothetical protein
LIVSEGKAPGRPPGVEPRSLLAGGPQRANRQLCAIIALKEIAMKTFIIVTILSVGVLLRPEMAPTVNSDQKSTVVTIVNTNHASPTMLGGAEMRAIQGAGFLECAYYYDVDGDAHQMCCINFWLFKLCGDVNVSAAQRLIMSLI